MHPRPEQRGFTLIDLAATILAAGVLLGAGPALLRAAGQPEPSKPDGKAADPQAESARLRERMLTSSTNNPLTSERTSSSLGSSCSSAQVARPRVQ